MADIAPILCIEKECPLISHWSDESYKAVFAADAPERILLVAQNENGLQGFIVARITVDECDLENIAVASSYRRNGIGSRLARSLIDVTRRQGVRRIHLEVRESNAPARAFYGRLGFSQTGVRKSYYSEPSEDAVLYVLTV